MALCASNSSVTSGFLAQKASNAERSFHVMMSSSTGELYAVYCHDSDVVMDVLASQITGVSTVYSTDCSDTDQRKHQSSASLAPVRGIHRWPVNSPHKWPVTPKMFPFDDVIMVKSAEIDRAISSLDRSNTLTVAYRWCYVIWTAMSCEVQCDLHGQLQRRHMSAMASQITGNSTVYPTACWG